MFQFRPHWRAPGEHGAGHRLRTVSSKNCGTATVEGKTVLIVGVGSIGGAAARHAMDFGMRVIGIRRSAAPHPAVDQMHAPDELHDLLPQADFVLLNAALTTDTRFLFGQREFGLMRKGAGFANMSRGGMVDPAALDAALREGQLGGAVIDVTFPGAISVFVHFVALSSKLPNEINALQAPWF